MKPKIAPTSPKSDLAQREFERLYTGAVPTIAAPPLSGTGRRLWLAGLIGLLAGVGGLAGLSALSRRLPADSWIRWFVPQGPATVTPSSSRPTEVPATSRLEQATAMAPLVPSVYQDVPSNAESVDQLPSPDRFRGLALMVANAGIALTTREVVPEPSANLRLLFDDRRWLPVREVIHDPASPFVFLRLSGDQLRSAKLAAREDLQPGLSVVGYGRLAQPNDLSPLPGVIASLDAREGSGQAVFIESSDQLERWLLFSPGNLPRGSPVATERGDVAGLALERTVDGRQVVVPIWYATEALRMLLKGTDLIRPSLGVQYLDVSRWPTLGLAGLTDSSTGALITTDDPTSRPAVAPRSPAALAKLQAGDLILKVNGILIDRANHLNEVIQEQTAGAEVTIELRRGDEGETVTTRLGARRP